MFPVSPQTENYPRNHERQPTFPSSPFKILRSQGRTTSEFARNKFRVNLEFPGSPVEFPGSLFYPSKTALEPPKSAPRALQEGLKKHLFLAPTGGLIDYPSLSRKQNN